MNYEYLTKPQIYRASRESSYDRAGRNVDYIVIPQSIKQVIAEIDGPGSISHIWMTAHSRDKMYLRKMMMLIYWDDEEEPSIMSPLGDFFGLGHGRAYTYQSAPFSTSVNPASEGQIGKGAAMNSWLPMPFRKKARIEIANDVDCDSGSMLYYYIDYRKYTCLPDDALYLHALWRRENPTPGFTGPGSVRGSALWRQRMEGSDSINLTGDNNFVIMSAKGRGHYIGANFSIDNLFRDWWGEGDDMIFIDRKGEHQWPPDMHGTGSEDYFCHAWGMQRISHLYCGMPWAEFENHNKEGKCCVYRYHLADPIPFQEDIHISIEHGTANCRSDDWACTAYWYQQEPHVSMGSVPSVAQRLPNPLYLGNDG
jgi:hypothetical protein